MKESWPVSLNCEELSVSVSVYFEHQRRQPQHRPKQPCSGRLSDEALLVHTRAIHAEVRQVHGWPRMTKGLCARDHRVGKQRVQHLMQQYGIRARGRRKFVVTTGSKYDLPIAPDLLERSLTADGPNGKWTSNIYPLHRNGRRLAVAGDLHRTAQPDDRGLEHAAPHARQPGTGPAAPGMVPASTTAGADLAHGSQ